MNEQEVIFNYFIHVFVDLFTGLSGTAHLLLFFFTFRTLTLFQVDTVSITHIFNSIFTKQLCIYIFLIFFRYILFARGGKSSHILYSNRSNNVQAL